MTINDIRDKLISGIEDKVSDEKRVKLLHKEILDLFQEFQDICNDLCGNGKCIRKLTNKQDYKQNMIK